ncbi:MAG: bifunctional riboflavin kinase/FMN adenylyltransferase, partial [Planctomycetota bacterium]
MREYYGWPDGAVTSPRPVVTLGMFDGVHLGHRVVIERACGRAAVAGVEALVVTFDRHPRCVTDPVGAPPMITSLTHRLTLFDMIGADAALVLPFDEDLAALDADGFARMLLVERLGAGAVVVGHDARFGRDRAGDAAFLSALGQSAGFDVEEVPPVTLDDGTTVSSSAIRQAVAARELDRAAAMLGRPVSVLGTVVTGQGIGRTLGFPTLNLDPHHELHPPRGVYVARTRVGDTVWPSVINIGHRP